VHLRPAERLQVLGRLERAAEYIAEEQVAKQEAVPEFGICRHQQLLPRCRIEVLRKSSVGRGEYGSEVCRREQCLAFASEATERGEICQRSITSYKIIEISLHRRCWWGRRRCTCHLALTLGLEIAARIFHTLLGADVTAEHWRWGWGCWWSWSRCRGAATRPAVRAASTAAEGTLAVVVAPTSALAGRPN
jgi:hypothetical protein